jgi:molybdopterin/thiamine biosynthesis adenylyltransferase
MKERILMWQITGDTGCFACTGCSWTFPNPKTLTESNMTRRRFNEMGMLNELDTNIASIEARTIQKTRIRILPFVFLLFAVALLDRVNMGLQR